MSCRHRLSSILPHPQGSGKSMLSLRKLPSLRKQTPFPGVGTSQHEALSGSLAMLSTKGIVATCYKNIPGPGSSQSLSFPVGPVGATMGQEVIRNRQPLGHLSTAGAGILSQPLLSGTATSSVCPLSLAHSFSKAGWMPTCAGHPEPANSSLLGEEAPRS